jgi:hypothetical protein
VFDRESWLELQRLGVEESEEVERRHRFGFGMVWVDVGVVIGFIWQC